MGSNGFSSLDATTSGQIFRKDFPIILACDRHQAKLFPIRVDSLGLAGGTLIAGTVMARNTTSGYYQAYVNSGASGLGTAACVLFEDVTPASGDTDMAIGIFGGNVYQAKLTGLDANAISNLNARSVIDASGIQILIF